VESRSIQSNIQNEQRADHGRFIPSVRRILFRMPGSLATGLLILGRLLLRIPLFYKILLANLALVALAGVAAAVVTAWHIEQFPDILDMELIVLVVVTALVTSCVVNYMVLKLALIPLDRIQAAIDEFQQGKLGIRIDPGPLSDDRFDRLVAAGHQMLATLEQDAQQLHHLSRKTLQAQEEERRRVARELHDETGQTLTSLLVRLRLLENLQDVQEVRQHLQELRKLTAQTLEDVRRIALELRPKILDDLGLTAALSWLVDEFNAAHHARATLRVSGIERRLPEELELVFYRVAQEALTNAARHAHARRVTITVKRGENCLGLEVADDGVGFDMAAWQARPHEGMGLLGMRERLALVGGEIVIESKPGAGTRIFVRAPLNRLSYKGAWYDDWCTAVR